MDILPGALEWCAEEIVFAAFGKTFGFVLHRLGAVNNFPFVGAGMAVTDT